jgi:hypothetical protein
MLGRGASARCQELPATAVIAVRRVSRAAIELTTKSGTNAARRIYLGVTK